MEIGGLARKPKAARLGIGSDLLFEMLRSQKKGKTVQVRLDPSNPALSLFKKWGFEKAEGSTRKELIMQLNWEKYAKATSQQ